MLCDQNFLILIYLVLKSLEDLTIMKSTSKEYQRKKCLILLSILCLYMSWLSIRIRKSTLIWQMEKCRPRIMEILNYMHCQCLTKRRTLKILSNLLLIVKILFH
eukprot:NODE_11_length_46995_cov_0.451872.p28 type:complete len:104 gc:universal NODE_11_length_46995_cov_0.451872:40144-39833(-)